MKFKRKNLISRAVSVALSASMLMCSGLATAGGYITQGIMASAADVTVVKSGSCGAEGDNVTYTLNREGTLIISGSGEMKDYSSWYGFHNDNIKKTIIKDGVTSIGDYAFYNCTGLTSITIPDSVASIGEYAFYDCTGLTSITIPDSVASIGEYAFYDCKGLTNITIPYSVTSIGKYAFYGCTGLTSITIGNGVISIGDSAFEGCTGLTSITIPNSVTEMGSGAFYGCKNLQSVLISENIQSWNDDVFYGMWSSFNLYGKKGSYAEKYAQDTKHGNFYLIDDNGFAYSENDDGTVSVV